MIDSSTPLFNLRGIDFRSSFIESFGIERVSVEISEKHPNKSIREKDWITAFTLICSAAQNINILDSVVFNKFISILARDYSNIRKARTIKVIETGEFKTIKEVCDEIN